MPENQPVGFGTAIDKVVGFSYLAIAVALVFFIFFNNSVFGFFKEFIAFDVILMAAILWLLSVSDALFKQGSKVSEKIGAVFAFSSYFLLLLALFYGLGFFRIVESDFVTIILFFALLAKNIFLIRKNPKETFYLIDPTAYSMAFGLGPAVLYIIYQNSLFFYAWIVIYCIFQGFFLVFKERIREAKKKEAELEKTGKRGFSAKLFILWAIWTAVGLWAGLFFLLEAKNFRTWLFGGSGTIILVLLVIVYLLLIFIIWKMFKKKK